MNQEVAKLLNEQVTREFYSEYLYLSYADYLRDINLDGFAHWYEIQAQEERDHAMLFRTFLQNNGVHVELGAIDKPPYDFKDVAAVIDAAYNHERFITQSIHKLYKAARDAEDFRTMQFLDWFVKEQGEEEKNADDVVKKFKMFGHDANALYSLNQELLSRVYTAPSLVL